MQTSLADLPYYLKARDRRHSVIANHDINRLFADDLDNVSKLIAGQRLPAIDRNNHLERSSHSRFVIDYEQFWQSPLPILHHIRCNAPIKMAIVQYERCHAIIPKMQLVLLSESCAIKQAGRRRNSQQNCSSRAGTAHEAGLPRSKRSRSM